VRQHGRAPLVVTEQRRYQARVVRFISQEELGARASLHRNYVGAIERGKINPTFRTLVQLAHGLRMPLSELVGICERHDSEQQSREHAV